MDNYFNGLSYSTFVNELGASYQKNKADTNSVLTVLISINSKFRDDVAQDVKFTSR